jgi:hypothetical protein
VEVTNSTPGCAVGRPDRVADHEPSGHHKINMPQEPVTGRSNRYTIDQIRAPLRIDFSESTWIPLYSGKGLRVISATGLVLQLR